MAFLIPTLDETRAAAAAELALRMGLSALPPQSNLLATANAFGGSQFLLQLYLEWISEQILPITAEGDQLDAHATLWLEVTRKPATPAAGSVSMTGAPSSTIPAGQQLQRDLGQGQVAVYFVDATVVSDGLGNASAPITAEVAQAAGNADVGAELQLVQPIPGVDSTAIVEDDGTGEGLTGGTDREDDDQLRARITDRIQNPPAGGNAADYVRWAKETPGVDVTRAWALPLWLGAGTVGVTFTVDDDPGGPIPNAAQVAAVQAYIDPVPGMGQGKAPIGAVTTVFAPIQRFLNPVIALSPNTATVQAAVIGSLEDWLFREATPAGGKLLLSQLNEAISTAQGEEDHETLSPTGDVITAQGDLYTLGVPTWSSL